MMSRLFSRVITPSTNLPPINTLDPPTSVRGTSIADNLAIVVVVTIGAVVVVVTSAATTPLIVDMFLLPAIVVTVAIDLWPVATVVAVTSAGVVAPVATGTVVTVVVGTAGEAIVIDVATASDVGPVFDAASNTEPDSKRRVTVPSEVHVTETLTVTFAVPAAGVATHPVAVPVKEKSPAAIPDTTSENVNV
jgi:hypothetical protein